MSARPEVVNIRHEPYRSDPSLYVYVGRAGKGQDGTFGNPHPLNAVCRPCSKKKGVPVRHAPDEVLALYHHDFHERVWSDGAFYARVVALAGKKLGCFCTKKDGSGKCHAHTIADFVAWQPEGVKDLCVDGSPLCPRCECCGMSRESCEACDGEGGTEQEDPCGLDPAEWVPCEPCQGHGAWWRCACNLEGLHQRTTQVQGEAHG